MDYFVFERELEDKLASVLAEKSLLHTLAHDGSRVLYDPDNPRTEITITRLQEQDEGQMKLF